MKTLLFILSSFYSFGAYAADYYLPTDSGWYQLQDANTFRTVCSTGDQQPCSIEAGQYVIINHNTDSSIKTPVTVSEQNGNAAIVHVVNSCTETTTTECNASCPTGYLASGISCSIQREDGTITVSRDLISRFGETKGYCEIPGLFDFSALLRLACVKQ